MRALCLAQEASWPVQGCVGAGCSCRLGNPALVSQTPIRLPGEKASAPWERTACLPPSVCTRWVKLRLQHLCLRTSSSLTPAWVSTNIRRPRVMEVNRQTSATLGTKHGKVRRHSERTDHLGSHVFGVSSFLKLCHQVFLGPRSCQGKQNPVFTTKAKRKDLPLLRSVGCSFARDYPSRVVTLPEKVFIYRAWIFVYRQVLNARRYLPDLDEWSS